MSKWVVSTLALVSFLSGHHAMAEGKVEQVQNAVKKACSKDLANDEALRQVKNLFLSCVPGDKVDVDGCKVPCLKENSGAVVGQ
ncbi:hypothetical protein [Bdellovibrio sp. KM01]|uniref:hypothetical protein n=1 Tax=Bdellovibrio sp. KM01 TaxID=2748865 RepID=UPI0015E99F12|nr:hypothetical protein [Bdellovibrio sp. KM01]QLY25897.1 hypothetical protein HW988_02325 [Bdellovibrio sp. KM01]